MSIRKDTKWLINKSKSLFGEKFDYSRTEYKDAKTKVQFRCIEHDYTFEQTSNGHFNSKHPCKLCLRDERRESLSDGLEIFKNKIRSLYGDIFCFEQATYFNQRTPITLKCKRHNNFISKEPHVFLRGHGCDMCSKEEASLKLSISTLEEIKEYVSKFNGTCLSKDYVNNEAKLDFECEVGHKFKKSWSAVKNSLRWCPKCSPNKLIGESLARLILEHLLEISLPSCYLDFMEGLQLDGYNAERKIAFEYQGYQHYTEDSHYHTDLSGFNSQLERDKAKKELCDKNGITLIEIFEFKTIRLGRIELFVRQVQKKLKEHKIEYNSAPFELNLVELYRGKKSSLYDRAKRVVEDNNGIIQPYVGSESKHTYTCAKGHEIKNRTLGVIVKSNASCPICESENLFTELKNIIENRGGILLDKQLKPKGLSEKYNWICNKGHHCQSKGQYLYDGYWCRICQKENQKIKLNKEILVKITNDVQSGKYLQKDLKDKYGISYSTFRRIIKDHNITPNYLPHNPKNQVKRTKGYLLQIHPNTLEIIKKFESLESVKHDPSSKFKPEGIRHQMKLFKKAYGFYWCREDDLEKTIEMIRNHK